MFRLFSLTSRLALFFTTVAAIIVLGLGILFTAASERHFVDLDRGLVQDKRQLIESIVGRAVSTDEAIRRLHEALSHHHGLLVAIADLRGDMLYRTDGFQPPPFPAASPSDQHPGSLGIWVDHERSYRALTFRTDPVGEAATPLQVLIAIDTLHHRQFMAELRRSLLLYAVAAVVVSGLLGWLAAYKGLSPLRAMKQRAITVSAQRFDARMPADSVPVEMAELARELNRMLDRLQSDFERLSEFAADLAHELRTPISNLMTQTQVALSATRDAATYQDILASNAEELQRMARMVSDMLFLAKTERGVDLPSRERFSCDQEARALLEFYEAVADDKDIALRQRGHGDIVGDRLMFRRAISNLLSNALRHTPRHGEVVLDIGETANGTRITVENHGEVIDPRTLDRLFDRFYRSDPSRVHADPDGASGSDGAGLGLSITRAIVVAHGGTITVESADGRTRFNLDFPRHV